LKASRDEKIAIARRYERMSTRERQVFALVTTGLLNKQIAFDLGLAERTVKVHRARAMEKMEADSFAHLVQMAQLLGVHTVKERA
jgi:FixJ family two-component response regulator